jgi:hypothetical protein
MSELSANAVPQILTNVGSIIAEYASQSDTLEAEAFQTKTEFKKKYKECVAAELEGLEDEGEESNIKDFTSAISLLKLEQTKNMTSLQGKQAKMTQDLKRHLGEIGGVSRLEQQLKAAQQQVKHLQDNIAREKKQRDEKLQKIIQTLGGSSIHNNHPHKATIASLQQLL